MEGTIIRGDMGQEKAGRLTIIVCVCSKYTVLVAQHFELHLDVGPVFLGEEGGELCLDLGMLCLELGLLIQQVLDGRI
jgi:hypothetical protein